MNPSTILVTGATAGVGFATAARLAKLGHTIFVTGRNEERGCLKKVLAHAVEHAGGAPLGDWHVVLGMLSVAESNTAVCSTAWASRSSVRKLRSHRACYPVRYRRVTGSKTIIRSPARTLASSIPFTTSWRFNNADSPCFECDRVGAARRRRGRGSTA
jgi:NAD(P)-dependent dehydrogenase (short-subunit alcohol dehydrogenase family)